MKKNFIIAGLLVAGLYSAQQEGSVGINDEPKGATLHVTVAAGADVTKGQGIAVPNVDKTRLNQMTGDIAISAMVYVTDASAADDTRTTKVKEVGYHYFDGTEWVKLGGTSASSSAGSVKASFRAVARPLTAADWKADDYAIGFTGTNGALELPSASANKNRIIAVRNMNGQATSFSGTDIPSGNSAIKANSGLLLISDGTNWHVIGGF